jgi:flagellar basal body-associated protein FliL
MADKDKKPDAAPAAPAEGAAEKPGKKGLPIKTIAIVAIIMVVEAALVIFAFGLMGGPKESKAEPAELHDDESNLTTEIEIVAERFQNLTTGRVWVWDIEVYVQTKQKNQERVERVLEQRGAELKEGLGRIVSSAQHTQLKEPDRQSINRQFAAFLEKILGNDSDGKPLIERVLIPKCRGFPADF